MIDGCARTKKTKNEEMVFLLDFVVPDFLLHGLRTQGLAKLVMSNQQTDQEGRAHEGNADTEGRTERQHVSVQDCFLDRDGKILDVIRIRDNVSNSGVEKNQVFFDTVIENGSTDGHTEDGSDGTEESGVGGGNSNISSLDGRLDGEHDSLHAETKTQTVDEQKSDNLAASGVLVQESQETDTGRRQDQSGPDERSVLSPLGDHESRRDRGNQEPDNQRQHLQTRRSCRLLTDNLEVQWHEEHDAKEAHSDEEAGGKDGAAGSTPEETEGNDGLDSHLKLNKAEAKKDGEASAEETNDAGRVPSVGAATPVQGQQDHDKTGNQGEGSSKVHTSQLGLEGTAIVGQMEDLNDGEDGDGTDGQVDEESPTPRGMIREDTSQQRSDNRRESKDGSNDALVLASVAERDQVCDDDHDSGHDSSGTNTGNTTSNDDPGHVLCGTAEGRADQEDTNGKQEGRLTTKDVGGFSVPTGDTGDRVNVRKRKMRTMDKTSLIRSTSEKHGCVHLQGLEGRRRE